MPEYRTFVGLKESGPFGTFKDAFADMYARMRAFTENGCAAQELEGCWMAATGLPQTSDNPKGTMILFWQSALDLAAGLNLVEPSAKGAVLKPDAVVDANRAVDLAFSLLGSLYIANEIGRTMGRN